MKKLKILIGALCLICLASCGNDKNEQSTTSAQTTTSETTQAETTTEATEAETTAETTTTEEKTVGLTAMDAPEDDGLNWGAFEVE